MLISRAVVALAALATSVYASSTARNPLERIGLAQNADILTSNHRVTALSTFELAFDFSGARIRLSLEPNHDIFVEGAKVSFLGSDGEVERVEAVDRLQHRVFKGITWVQRAGRWDRAGWARIDIRRDGPVPLFSGTFTIDHDHHHVHLASHYKQVRGDRDPDIELRSDERMVIFRDSDHEPDEQSELKKRSKDNLACGSDRLSFNTQEEHPVYAAMRPRDDVPATSPFSPLFAALRGKRQNDTPSGGNGAGTNLIQSIGSTAGCPTTRKVALVGVATDCTYTTALGSDNKTRDNVISQMNQASQLFESTFNISLGLANLLVQPASCPTTPQQATPWNQACSNSFDIQDRLSTFSNWRGQQKDQYSHWTLLSTCNTGSAVGLAWLGQACATGSQANNASDGTSEQVAGANVVVRTLQEWQVIAHETGHTFGAVHDCDSTACQDANIVNSQQCCPLSASTCNANGKFIMNPSTGDGITQFSACSIGNICSAMGVNSVKSSCLSNNRGVALFSGQTCGNGIVEGDEQCDCGGTDGCGANKCCDPTTCKFKNNAVCDDSNEDCCKDCQLASANTVCRASSGTCDPEETCTGSSPYCPEDKTNPDGSACGGGLKCASGQCTSRDQQCKTIMGSYTQGNETYACDDTNCMLSCASPSFKGSCFGLNQNFLDGTPCVGGGHCANGQCAGSSVSNEIKSWIDSHRILVIAIAATVGGLILLSILGCCLRCIKRRKQRKIYKNNAAMAAAAQHRGPHKYNAAKSRSRSGNGGGGRRNRPLSPSDNDGPLLNPPLRSGSNGTPPWQPQTNHNIPSPPPMYQRNPSTRYA
ncbi:hypothetical protein K504DRAFT_381353 [Pleomassaria siparia CBS 279.74]|uniref:Disintegrin and metalloproteinase domain-containing protein B n=1 Tax=Pleomassaria siparia CBS 279.74 TaxID=1314801 RepID=A0A6G1K7B4_9PLEO|nr:hypothetical protein K504DRAFT_381353 [Pleomassaria siparia CBS 279.74]